MKGLDEPAHAVSRSWETLWVGEDDPRVRRPDAGELRGDRHEIADVLGQECTAVPTSRRNQRPVGKACQRRLRDDRRDVVPLRAEVLGDPWAVMLVEEQLHARGVICCRYSRSSRSAIASFASIQRSISSANSAWYRAAASTIAGGTWR